MLRMILMTLAIAFTCPAYAGEVNLEQSSIQWTGSKITGSLRKGFITPKSITVKAPKGVIESADVIMDMTTLTVTNLSGKKAEKFIRHMKADDFFDANQFPMATLNVATIKDGTARGRLTIKNKTHPVMFKVDRSDKTYTGQLKFDRTKFGIIYKSGSVFKDLGDKVIRDEVLIDFKIVLK